MTKPPFRLPSMADVAAARGTTGLTVASTFSGCGGSCLGFEMAGFRVVWANEFVEVARESYAANHPETLLDGRDIRTVQAADILKATGLKAGELDVFNGSPPCQAFSTAGAREKGWGKDRDYGGGVKQRNEDLFFDYIRLVDGLQPRVFVAENVAGLTQGTALGYFKEVMRALAGCGYAVRCRILDAQWLGVPQSRRRAIFIGVRNDLQLEPEFPKPLPYHYMLREVLPGISEASSITNVHKSAFSRSKYGKDFVDRPIPCITTASESHFVVAGIAPPSDEEDVMWLKPDSAVHRDWQKLRPGQKSAKYFNVSRANPSKPSPCIMASGGGGPADTTSTLHPYEPRRFTMAELRIVCGFPADFVLKGTYGQQWARLGNAVPPLMMRAVARVLRDSIFAKLKRVKRGWKEAA